jgi:excisionase family DNA binding protein
MGLVTMDFLDVKQAALLLRVKESTIYTWVHQRRIPFRKHGRRVVFARADLEVWSAAQAVGMVE